jgi:hypothetical protein
LRAANKAVNKCCDNDYAEFYKQPSFVIHNPSRGRLVRLFCFSRIAQVQPLFGVGQVGKSVSVTAQDRLNVYAEIKPDGEGKSNISFYGTPGLVLFTSFGDTPIRGIIAKGDYMYPVHRGTFWQVDNAGTKTSRGTLATTSGRVDLATDGAAIVIVDGTSMYHYEIATTTFQTVGSALFSSPVSVTWQDGYFIACFLDSQRYQYSEDGLTWDALDFTSADSNPDDLLRVFSNHGQLVLPGEGTTEFAATVSDPDSPFVALKNSTMQFGLAAPWSLTAHNDSIAGVWRSDEGQVQVMMQRGYGLIPLSNPEIDSTINSYATVSDATAYSYKQGGHPMLQANFPAAQKSHLYDALTSLWSRLESGLSGGRHRAEIRVDYLNKPRVTDYENGNIYTLSVDTYTDNGDPIPRELTSARIFNRGKYITIHEIELFFEMGVGLITGQGSNPMAMLQASKDGGKTWGNERWVSMGRIGEYKASARWHMWGSAKDWVFRLRVTDPVKFVLTGENVRAEVGQ